MVTRTKMMVMADATMTMMMVLWLLTMTMTNMMMNDHWWWWTYFPGKHNLCSLHSLAKGLLGGQVRPNYDYHRHHLCHHLTKIIVDINVIQIDMIFTKYANSQAIALERPTYPGETLSRRRKNNIKYNKIEQSVFKECDSLGNKTEYIPISDFCNPNLSLHKIKKGCFRHKNSHYKITA